MIHFATEQDVPAIVDLCLKFKDTEHYKHYTKDERHIHESLVLCIGAVFADVLVYKRGERIVGAAVGLASSTLLCPDMQYNEQFIMCEHPFGTVALINALSSCAKERECKRMVIGVSTSDNPRYCRLLEKKGFIAYGRAYRKEL